MRNYENEIFNNRGRGFLREFVCLDVCLIGFDLNGALYGIII